MKRKLFAMLSAAAVLFAASCTKDIASDVDVTGEMVTVSFVLNPEGLNPTRAVTYPGTGDKPYPEISDGTKADKLIYAVYDKDDRLLAQYGENPDDDPTIGYGQCVKIVKTFPTTVSLRLVRGQQYKVAFWAQNSTCTAYTTTDLHKIEVHYAEANGVNNDELRDAFCKTETFTAVESGSRTVILRRPLAQINVGVAGYDYEAASKGDCRVVESKIRIERVARFFDVVTNSVDTSDESLQTIEFDYSTIPAYINMKDASGNQQIPEEKYDLEASYDGGLYYNGLPAIYSYENDLVGKGLKTYPEEALLRVDRDHKDGIAPYMNEQDEQDAIKAGGSEAMSPYTETYKYLSMCYVLVPDRTDGTSTYSTTLDNVYIYLKYHNESMAPKEIHLTQVPAQRNWRTNILGELLTANINFEIDIDPIYAGDYNYPDWVTIAEGVSYDPVEDAILLSNAMGLQWLGDMVNAEYRESDYSEIQRSLIMTATKLSSWPANNNFTFADVTVKLLNDIDFAKSDNIAGLRREWTPIGYGNDTATNFWGATDKRFNGIFDGGNHTISNLVTITPPTDTNSGANFGSGIEASYSVGLFGQVGQNATIKNIRLKDVTIRGHYWTGAVVGGAYGGDITIENCYVDGGTIDVTPTRNNNNYYDRANNVGGIVGCYYSNYIVRDCYVRNLTIRAYRTIGAIIGSLSGYNGWWGHDIETVGIYNNKADGVMLIADQFQPYYSTPYGWSVKAAEISEIIGNPESVDPANIHDNTYSNVTIVKFDVVALKDGDYGEGNQSHPGKYRYSEIANVPLDVFPVVSDDYTDYVHFASSIVGGPSTYKSFKGNDEDYDGSGRVGLAVNGLVLDGLNYLDAEEQTTHNDWVLTVTGVEGENDCAVHVTGGDATIKDLTVRGDSYAYTGVLLEPESGATVTFDHVMVYDAIYTIDGEGNNSTLDVKDSNLRGWTKYGSSWTKVTFANTVFELGTGTDIYNVGKCTPGSDTTFDKCTFRTGFAFESTNANLTFTDCYCGGDTDLDPLVKLDASNIEEKLGITADKCTFN